jgi:hypothetical protein
MSDLDERIDGDGLNAPIFRSPVHPFLQQLADEYADYMAAHCTQGGHQGFPRRYDRIKKEMGLAANEITVESWPWEESMDTDELWRCAVRDWRQSEGHARVVDQVHKALGAAKRKSERNGIWYFICLVAD